MKFPSEYTNPREYIVNTFSGNEYVVDSENRLVVPFPDGTKDLITSKSLCSGKSTTYSSSEEGDGTSSTNPSSIASGVITSRLFIGDYLALDGTNGIITIGIPKTGLVGDNPYMMFGSSGIYGMYGDTDQPWFIVSMSEATYTYINPDTLTQSTKTFYGGDFFIGNYETAYLYWEYATHKLTIAGDVIIAGDLESANFVLTPVVVGYKLEHETGNAYFGGAVISGNSTIGTAGTTADTIGTVILPSGHFVDSNMDTNAKQILGEFTFQSSGALKMATDNNNGVWISPTGILAKKSGVNTLAIGSDGNATFGGKIQTGSSGQYIVLDPFWGESNPTTTLYFVDDNSIVASMGGNFEHGTNAILSYFKIESSESVINAYYYDNGSKEEICTAMGTYYGSNPYDVYGLWIGNMAGYAGATSANQKMYITVDTMDARNILPHATDSYSLGSTSKYWKDVYTTNVVATTTSFTTMNAVNVVATSSISTPSLTLNGSTRTSWPSSFGGTLNDLSINVSKNWGSYNITNLGSLIPGSGTTTLGDSSYYWSSLYIGNIYGAFGSNPIYINNNAFTRSLIPYSSVSYDIGSSGYYYQNVFTQSIRLRTGVSANPSNSGEIRYYDGAGGGFRGNVGGWLGQFDMTAK